MGALVSPVNANYAATIIEVPPPADLAGLDNLVGIPLFGYTALTTRGIEAGELRVLFLAETQLDADYARESNLFRDTMLNKDAAETGYLEPNGRVKAIRLRKHPSNALLMPLESLAHTGYDVSTLKVGDTFDTLNGKAICRKYEAARGKQGTQRVGPKIRQRVDQKLFPMHLDTEHLFRNLGVFRTPRIVVTTQKLHGTSVRIGNVPAARDKGWFERKVVNRWFKTADHEFELTAGSRRVIKGRDDNNHFYSDDVWSDAAKSLEGKIPTGMVLYGELVGFAADGSPIQKSFSYGQLPGTAELYVYRVASVNSAGVIADLSWEGVKEFCASVGVKTVPELDVSNWFLPYAGDDELTIRQFSEKFLDQRLSDKFPQAVVLSDPKTVDEGVCCRVEGIVPRIWKCKSPEFLVHESRALDDGVADMESAA